MIAKGATHSNQSRLEQGGGGGGNGAASTSTWQDAGGNRAHIVEETNATAFGHDDPEFQDISQMEQTIRLGFVRKVYAILCIQLLVTFAIMSLFAFEVSPGANPIREAVMTTTDSGVSVLSSTGFTIYMVSLVTTFGSLIVLSCVPGAARKYPNNLCYLSIFTISLGVMIGLTSLRYSAPEIATAFGITALLVLLLTIFACQTKIDFTGYGPYLFCFLIILFIFGFFFGWTRQGRYIYAGLGVLLFSFYLVYDTQLIVGGKHKKYQYSVDDYVFAALSLYIDIINLFLFILALGGGRD